MEPSKLVARAEGIVDGRPDFGHKDFADEIGVAPRTWRRWRSGDRTPSGDKLCSLKEWLEDQTGESYSGPADAERDPQAVAAEEMQEYGTGGYGRPESPSEKDEPAPNAHITGHVAGRKDLDPEQVVERQRDLYARKRKKERAKQSQTIRFDYGPVCLAFQGDEHYGNSGCDIDHALEDAKIIAETPGMYAIKMGDLIDNFLIGYLQGENAKQSLSIEEQWECAKHQLRMMSGSVIGVVGGNHTGWSRSMTHLDPVRDIAPDEVLYDPHELQFRLKVGRASKDVFLRHKFSKGHSQWNETHALEKAAKFSHPGHDIYAAAHIHSGLHLKMFAKRGGGYGVAVQTDTYKKFDDYGDKQGYSEYPKEDVAGALVIHEDGEMVPMKSLERAASYMDKFYTR